MALRFQFKSGGTLCLSPFRSKYVQSIFSRSSARISSVVSRTRLLRAQRRRSSASGQVIAVVVHCDLSPPKAQETVALTTTYLIGRLLPANKELEILSTEASQTAYLVDVASIMQSAAEDSQSPRVKARLCYAAR